LQAHENVEKKGINVLKEIWLWLASANTKYYGPQICIDSVLKSQNKTNEKTKQKI